MVDFGAGKKASQDSPAPDERRARGRASRSDRGGPSAPSLAFEDVVGQADLKEALLAVGANEALDGLLVSGEKGTAKSTLVRGLAALLPDQRAIADCPCGCHPADPTLQCTACRERTDPPVERRAVPLVTLPLGATRDRVVGSVSVADALDGEPTFEPGLLARAHRGILYVDEVNLLDDHLVDVLLDVAASGVNRVERDGVSVAHPAELTLIGTMNPEEGDLRPQLRDRFALSATATGCRDVADRVAVVRRVLGDSRDGTAVDSDATADDTVTAVDSEPSTEQSASTDDPAVRLRRARSLLDDVTLPDDHVQRIAELGLDAGLDGHRGDVAIARTARTFAALAGRTCVVESDVRRAAEYALPHRLRSGPLADAPSAARLLDEHFDDGGADEGAADDREGAHGRGDPADDGPVGDETASAGERTDGEHQRERSDDEAPDGTDRPDADDTRSSCDREASPSPHDSRGRARTDAATADHGQSSRTADAPADGSGDTSTAGRTTGSTSSVPGADREQATDDGAHGPGQDECSGEADGRCGIEARSGTPDAADDGERTDDDPTGASGDQSAPLVPGQRRAADRLAADPTAATPAGDGPCGASDSATIQTDRSADGRRRRTKRAQDDDRVDAVASVRAAAARGGEEVTSRDLRATVRERDGAALVVFAVDASASMRPAMRTAKETVLELLRDAYQARDDVAFVAFGGTDAEVLLPPTDSVQRAARHLKELPAADRTPLPAGVRTAAEVVERADPTSSVAVLVTDGRANEAEGSPVGATRDALDQLDAVASEVLLVDVPSRGRGSLSDLIVERTGATRLDPSDLTAGRVDAAVHRATDPE